MDNRNAVECGKGGKGGESGGGGEGESEGGGSSGGGCEVGGEVAVRFEFRMLKSCTALVSYIHLCVAPRTFGDTMSAFICSAK